VAPPCGYNGQQCKFATPKPANLWYNELVVLIPKISILESELIVRMVRLNGLRHFGLSKSRGETR
jgi:hypothetical protein